MRLIFRFVMDLLEFLDELDQIVLKYGGRLYMSKDARMKPEVLKAGYARLDEFRAIVKKYNPSGKIIYSITSIIIDRQLTYMATVLILGAASDMAVAIARKFASRRI